MFEQIFQNKDIFMKVHAFHHHISTISYSYVVRNHVMSHETMCVARVE